MAQAQLLDGNYLLEF